MAAAKKPEPKFPAESRTVNYLPAGVGVDPYQGEPTLDPELAKIREEEIKRNDVEIVSELPEPTIDEALVKAREEELKRDAERAAEADSTASAATKKTAAKKSSKS